MTQTKPRIQEKFYPLEVNEWKNACNLLKPAELKVLYYLRAIDPFSNGISIKALVIAQDLKMTRQTVYKAIAVLNQKDFIDTEESELTVRLRPKGIVLSYANTSASQTEECRQKNTTVAISRHPVSNSDNKVQIATDNSCERQSPSETPAQQESCDSKNIYTYLDFKKTLSEEQRASFLNFCHEKTKNLSQQVNDLEAWLAHQNKAGQNRWEVYYEKFQNHERPKVKKSPSSAIANKFEAELEQQRERALSALKNEAPTVPQPLKKAEIKVEPPQAFVIAMPKEEASGQDTAIAPPESKTDDSPIVIEENDLTEIAVAHSLTLELEHLAQESEPQFSLLASLVTENETYNLADNAFGNELPKVAYSPVETERDAVHQHSSKNVSPDCSRQQQDRAIATNKSQESATPVIYQQQQPDCAIATNENQESAKPTIYESDTESTSPSSTQEWLRGQL